MVNHLRKNFLVAVVASLLCWTPFAGFGQNSIGEIKQEARAAKLSPELLSIQQEAKQPNSQKAKSLRQAASPDNEIGLVKTNELQVRDGMVAIDAVTNTADGQALLSDLQTLGLQNGEYYKRIVFGYFPIDKLDQLKNVKTLHVARPAFKAIVNVGKTTSQGDSVMRADKARTMYGVTGAGSKVGVMSDSYDVLKGAAAGVMSGDLPPNVQVLRDVTTGTDEGRAMAEIVHDVAPGADIAFHTANGGYASFANGIVNLAAAGCNIIVDDIIYLFEPFFQDGIIAQAVNYVNKVKNVSYFSSVGNYNRQSYQSGFRNSGKPAPGFTSGAAHDFVGNGTILQKVTIPARGRFRPVFQWSDPFYSEGAARFPGGSEDFGILGAKTDLDIYVYFQGVLQPQLSSIYPSIGDDPIEYLDLSNTSTAAIEIEIAIVKVNGPDPSVIKWVDFGSGAVLQFPTQSSTGYGHSNAEGAIAVGAAAWYQTPAYSARLYPLPLIESFSSAGGTPILFTEYGQPIPPVVRQKPQIVAPDGGNTTFFGQQLNDGDTFPNFFGTSAAAPHAAAVAALLQERAKLSFSPADVLKRLQSTAIDMDDPLTPGFDTGFDFRTGYGFIQADKALMFGEPLAILEPIFDCQTRRITLQTTGGDGTPITFIIPGVTRTSPTSTTGVVEAGVVADAKPIVITAVQNGVTKTYTFNFVEYCSRPKAFTLVAPLYNCATGAITFQTQGGDASTVTYSAPGVKRSSPTDPNGTIEAGLLYDPKPITITATQRGVTATYVFNFVAYCNSRARLAATEPGSGLQVRVLNNPVATDWVELEVRGAQGQPLTLKVHNSSGALSSEQSVNLGGEVETHRLRLGQVSGLYLLQVSTPSQTQTIKVVRQ